jgi:hypothetical protein
MSEARNRFGLRGEAFEIDATSSKWASALPQRIEFAFDPAFFVDPFLVDLGCATWRLHQKMFDADTGEARDEFRQLARHVATIRDRLSELGLQIQDHTGKPYDSGQSLEVLAFQPTDGIPSETVIETVRPTLYLRDQRILKGQVIVGTPSGTEEGRK